MTSVEAYSFAFNIISIARTVISSRTTHHDYPIFSPIPNTFKTLQGPL